MFKTRPAPSLPKECVSCGSRQIQRGKTIMASGRIHVYDKCLSCGKNANGNAMYISQKNMNGEIASLPIFEDYRTISEPCQRCGSTDGTELHHYAPRHIFEDADAWPTGYLCPACHQEWHKRIRSHKG